MNSLRPALGALTMTLLWGCGGKPPETPDPVPPPEAQVDSTPTAAGPAPGAFDEGGGRSGNPCTAFELDLMAALSHSACEVPNVAKNLVKPQEVKDKITVSASIAPHVGPGSQNDITVTYKNKGAVPVSLDFIVDPFPRFSVETFDAKTNKRVDPPTAPEPKLPDGMEPRVPGDPKTARVTLPSNGTATVKVPWNASRLKWAPEKLKGTPPELGYPKVPDKPLPKGKYNLRVITPLTNVFEGIDKEISAPRTSVDVP